jgi:hypothetical protein
MATIGAGLPTLADIMKRLDPNGAYAKVVEAMTKQCPLLEDMVWVEGNLPTGHVFTTRTGLPSIGWRKFNEGVASGKSSSDQITETCGILEGNSKVDCALADINGNATAFRSSEDMSFVTSFKHTLETAFFYESTKTAPERMMGLSPRLDTISGNPYANQVMQSHTSSSGSDQTSIWVVVHGPETVFGIYPKGSLGGLSYTDLGKQLTKDSGGVNEFLAYVGNWAWKVGLCVKDARYVVRIANIDTSALAATGSGLITDLVKAVEERIQDTDSGRAVIYCNRKIRTYLRLQAMDTTKNSTLTFDAVGGKPVLAFQGIPIHRTDALLNTEAVVS